MTNAELPIYLIMVQDFFVGLNVAPHQQASLAFHRRDDAQWFLDRHAASQGEPSSLYRIVEYRAAENVVEG